jgi:ribonuclease PH
MARPDSRALDALRPVEMITGFHRASEGSVLYRAGGTVVLCTASVESKVPPFLEGKGKGWLTAEYQMHPRANPPRREQRDGRGKAPSGRTLEIQRLVGRALRAAVDLDRIGERTVTIDCDVLEADGGTRTASVTGGFVALALALHKLTARGDLKERVVREPVAAISVGVVATASAGIVEIQGTAEGEAVPRTTIDAMVDLALVGIARLVTQQRAVLAGAGVDLAALTRPAS